MGYLEMNCQHSPKSACYGKYWQFLWKLNIEIKPACMTQSEKTAQLILSCLRSPWSNCVISLSEYCLNLPPWKTLEKCNRVDTGLHKQYHTLCMLLLSKSSRSLCGFVASYSIYLSLSCTHLWCNIADPTYHLEPLRVWHFLIRVKDLSTCSMDCHEIWCKYSCSPLDKLQ